MTATAREKALEAFKAEFPHERLLIDGDCERHTLRSVEQALATEEGFTAGHIRSRSDTLDEVIRELREERDGHGSEDDEWHALDDAISRIERLATLPLPTDTEDERVVDELIERATAHRRRVALAKNAPAPAGKCEECGGSGNCQRIPNDLCPDCGGTGLSPNCDGGDRG